MSGVSDAMDPVDRLEASFNGIEPGQRKRLVVFDCRFERDATEATGEVLDALDVDFNEFIQAIKEAFSIPTNETFVLCTTDRALLDFDSFESLEDGNTVHVLQREDQVLGGATKEVVTFVPHYYTMVQSGRYEYYASAGQKALPYALAELIDNSLSATSHNTGPRSIEIQLLFDETLGKHAVVVLDNGHGMSSKQLSNWAVYRLSKFNRKKGQFESENQEYIRPEPVYRSINSDISYFGVGGKQAVFYIGDSTRMITRPVGCPDVHELIISKEQFEKKEKNKEDIYSSVIRNRKVGDSSHVKRDDEAFLRKLIAGEFETESFTAVVITGVHPDHIALLKQDFDGCMRELAHVYHYYIHGPHGNMKDMSAPIEDSQQNIDIEITLREKPTKCPRVTNLRVVDDDMQTLYINATTDTFEFKAEVEGGGKVEGVLRYHPFMYDRETYPEDPHAMIAPIEDDDETEVLNEARGKRDIFECFWNGRLIPYTTVSGFDWCTKPSKHSLPAECYSRFSGVLFTDDAFKVSTNKLTFTDLEPKLRGKGTIFTRIVNGQEQRVKIQREFTQWLASCHEELDKQVKFENPKAIISRPDVATKKKQYPWTPFSSIEWDGKRYKAGQLVKSQKTQPIIIGTIVQFLLYGTYDDDVYATVGYVQLALEPKALHEEPLRAILISKIDRTATNASIKKIIDGELSKLPEKLNVTWPEGNEWPQNAVYAAGTPLGPLRVDITNKKQELISRFPTHSSQHAIKKLEVELKVVWHGGPDGDQEITSHTAKHASAWGYWFKVMGNLDKLGKHTLYLKTVLGDSNSNTFGGKPLPSYSLSFTITEANAERFVVCAVTAPLHVGVPFDLPLEIKDKFGNPALPPPGLEPLLECSGDVEVSFRGTHAKGTGFTITGVKARGKVHYHSEKQHDLKVRLPGLSVDTQTVKISLLPGNPHSIYVKGEDKVITVENGNPLVFDVEIHDEAGNIAAHPKLIVCCEVFNKIIPISKKETNQMLTEGKKVQQLVPSVAVDCSSAGAGRITTEPIKLNMNMKRERRNLKAKFSVPSQKSMAAVTREITVIPSSRVSQVEIWSQVGEDEMTLKNKEKIEWEAGDSIENLFYRLSDEGGKEVPLSEEHAALVKINWIADVNLEDLALGKLPVVQVPTLVKDQHFYQVSYQGAGGSVETSFTVVPRPVAPAKLKAILGYVTTMRMGDTLPGYIFLQLNDKYGNVTDVMTSTCKDELTVNAEGLDKQKLGFTWQENNHRIAVSGIRFLSGTPGVRELSFTWRKFSEILPITVTPGAPSQLKLLSGPEQPLQVLNEQGIPTPFLIQLCDEWGNASPDQRVVVRLSSTSSALKVKTNATSQPVDAEGKAKFTVLSVHGPKGEYTLQFSGTYSGNKKPMSCPVVKLTVVPNPNKPVSLQVEYDDKAVCPAGGTLPAFSVFAVSEEGIPVKGISPAAMSMFLWKASAGAQPAKPPAEATQLKCSRPMENENEDYLYFRDKGIPERTGRYIIQFRLAIGEGKFMDSKQFAIKVVANTPVTLAPDSEPATPVVSNDYTITHRTLVKDMTVRIVDEYSNPAALDLDGKVVVSIKSLSEASGNNVPLFDGSVPSVKVNLLRGSAYIKHLSIMLDSPGEDGKEYVLHFKPEIQGFTLPLAAYELKFRFYNDADNQRQMGQLSQKRDILVKRITQYKGIIIHYKEFYELLKESLQDANNKVARLKAQLSQSEVDVTQLNTAPDVDRCIQQKKTEAEQIISQRRRECGIHDPYKLKKDVLGKVARLALVDDEDAAAVISWHLGGELDCVVTKTTEAAQKIHADARGKQEVLPLDSVYVPPYNRSLPHIKNGNMLFFPRGNPVLAKDLLIFPEHQEDCEKLFKSLLGDTILMDDLHSANEYRKAVVQMKINCSTILTRRGERISGRGKFGGSRNQAPTIDRLGGRVFGAPVPQKYYGVAKQLGDLAALQTAMKNKMGAQTEHDQVKSQQEPEILRKKAEMEQAEKELEEVDKTLASSNAPGRTAVKRAAAEAPGNPAKRPKPGL